jgi:hypothetical protein
MILDKLKHIYDNNYFVHTILPAKVMHHNPYHLWSVHGVASSSKIRRLTNGCASSTTSGCPWLPKSILLLLALQGCYSSFVVVFNHMTMMPCRNLWPHVRCSHMIEPLGAHWCLGLCDVTHYNLFLCNLTSVLTFGLRLRI